MKLSKILPDTNNESSNGHFEGLSKGGILAKAFEYISELKETNNRWFILVNNMWERHNLLFKFII